MEQSSHEYPLTRILCPECGHLAFVGHHDTLCLECRLKARKKSKPDPTETHLERLRALRKSK